LGLLGARANLLRDRGGHSQVTSVELFFDLVFVFAVTQLSHTLLAHPTLGGALHAAMLLTAVWWVWINTSWITNWLDPRRLPVRLMLFALMLGGLVLSTTIPEAFGERALPFAIAFAAMQVGRSTFMLWAVRRHSPQNFRNFIRITAWHAMSGALWIAGALVEEARLWIWLAAVAVDCSGPAIGFRLPGMGASATGDWDVSGEHLAERCGLFVIIALGESILVTGATFAGLVWTFDVTAAFLGALLGSIAMWWIYFNIGAEYATRTIEEDDDPGRVARLTYTYIHLLPIAGIIVCAVADEMALTHPHGRVGLREILVLAGGPAIYLLGNALFKRSVYGRYPLSHLAGLSLLAGVGLVGPNLDMLWLSLASTAVLVIVAIWETVSLDGGQPGENTARTNSR
jgi:low temperature requirement protein LtrA